jgi:hypothetical protein
MKIHKRYLSTAFVVGLTSMALTQWSFAESGNNRGEDTEVQRLTRKAEKVRNLIAQNASSISGNQRDRIHDLLDRIEDVLVASGDQGGNGNGHGQPQHPQARNCTTESQAAVQDARKLIRLFAGSILGLEKSGQDAVLYTERWLKTHACSEAVPFDRDGRAIRALTYNRERPWLMSAADGAAYTERALEHRCFANVDYQKEGAKIYDIQKERYWGSLLREQDWVNDTRRELDTKYFSCDGNVDRP